MHASPLAIGIDASTQGVKALALGPDGPEALAAVRFADDLPSFGAPEGFVPDPDPAVHRAPPRLPPPSLRIPHSQHDLRYLHAPRPPPRAALPLEYSVCVPGPLELAPFGPPPP